MDDKWLTLEEFAVTARLHLDTVRRYAREGKLPVRKIGKRYLLKESDATAFMENLPAPYPKPAASAGPGAPDTGRTGTTGD